MKTNSNQISRWAPVALVLVSSTMVCGEVEPTGPPAGAVAGWKAETVVDGLRHPWGLTWLPDGRPLITAKHGTLHVVTNGESEQVPLEGLPDVFSENQGALMDIVLHPMDLESDRIRVYMTVSTGSEEANRTVLVRGVYEEGKVSNIETLFKAEPDKDSGQHFGSRMV